MAARNFTECAKNGGKIVTKRTKNGKVLKICYDKEGGSHARVIRNNKKYNNPQTKYHNKNEKQKQVHNHKPASSEDLLKLKEHFDKMYKQ